MPATFELGFKKGTDNRCGLFHIETLAGKGDHVGIVVTAAHFRLVTVMGIHRPDAGDLVGNYRHAVPGSTDEYAAITITRSDKLRRFRGKGRVIGRLRRVRADIHDFIAVALKELPDGFLQLESCVI